MDEPCIFCEIIAGERETHRPLTRLGVGYVAFEPLNPVTPGHTLIVPLAHVTDATTDPTITGHTMRAAAIYATDHGLWPCNFITSAGARASQTIFHLHIHIVPRAQYDGLQLPWVQ